MPVHINPLYCLCGVGTRMNSWWRSLQLEVYGILLTWNNQWFLPYWKLWNIHNSQNPGKFKGWEDERAKKGSKILEGKEKRGWENPSQSSATVLVTFSARQLLHYQPIFSWRWISVFSVDQPWNEWRYSFFNTDNKFHAWKFCIQSNQPTFALEEMG